MRIFKILGIVLCVILLVLSLNIIKNLNTSERVNVVKSEGILQTGEVANNIKYLKTEDIEIDTDDWKSSSPVCLKSQPGNSKGFGLPVAINDKYLAVGDQEANRVVIYSYDKSGNWLRTKEIVSPKDSVSEKYGFGFSYKLALDKDILVILAYTQKNTNEVTNQEDFQDVTMLHSNYRAVYKTNLDKEIKVIRIDLPEKEVIPGHSIAADDGKIAFVTSRKSQPRWINKAHLLANKKVKVVVSPDNKNEVFARDIALKNNLLLIGFSGDYAGGIWQYVGGAWLLDLNMPNSKPQKLSVPHTLLGQTVAISNQFAVVGTLSQSEYTLSGYKSAKTLIRAIKNGSTIIIDGHGKLSLDKNILARIRFPPPGSYEESILELFRLDQKSLPHLIQKRTNINNAIMQNGFLVTVKNTADHIQICTEKVS